MSLIRRGAGRVVGRKVIPWLLLLDLLRETHAHWQDQLSERERRRLTELLRQSRGRPGNLTERQRREVRELASKLDLVKLGKRAAFTAAGAKVGRKRR
ncbi:hypothetical protein [Patulibacter defluvii]|uniref:hypothetical protein n=1 Tax=Patulibacter defluvii TaxID=3095358 RepID=UPI002A75522F|nr:hypothetical protein [Patulibacter sp. DM4]